MTVAIVLACLLVPAGAIQLCERSKLAKTLGPVVLCYAIGIVAANIPGLHLAPAPAMTVSEAAVPLAIPLLLFSTEVRKWLGLARSLLVSFALACVAAMLCAGLVGWFFRGGTDEWWKVAGMLVGVYVGGTANMSAIGLALGARTETFVILNASDVVAGGVYLLFLLTLAQRLLLTFMRPFTAEAHHDVIEHPGEALPVWTRKHLPQMGLSFALAAGIVAVSAGGSWLLWHEVAPSPVLLAITSLGIAASLSSKVRGLVGSYELGEYVMLIFCVAVGSLADVSRLTGTSLTLFLFVCLVMLSSIVVHVALCALFRIDADTTLISSTATIYGPAFIGPVAASLRNRALVGPGLTLGLAGIALGTYLGLFTAWTLRWLAGG